MRTTVTVAAAKPRLSVARIVPEPSSDMAELFAFVDSQPMHTGSDAGELLRHLRDEERY